jgi:hypothetical protein
MHLDYSNLEEISEIIDTNAEKECASPFVDASREVLVDSEKKEESSIIANPGPMDSYVNLSSEKKKI